MLDIPFSKFSTTSGHEKFLCDVGVDFTKTLHHGGAGRLEQTERESFLFFLEEPILWSGIIAEFSTLTYMILVLVPFIEYVLPKKPSKMVVAWFQMVRLKFECFDFWKKWLLQDDLKDYLWSSSLKIRQTRADQSWSRSESTNVHLIVGISTQQISTGMQSSVLVQILAGSVYYWLHRDWQLQKKNNIFFLLKLNVTQMRSRFPCCHLLSCGISRVPIKVTCRRKNEANQKSVKN